ncbi:MAG: energy transducer TonB [Saprospiraceae bacterium]|nr:energy transducer TonB [Saprospiraceae bacterium]
MKKERKDKDFIKAAYFEGGRAAMDTYVKKELRYPKEALAAKIEGRVTIRYTVDFKGKVIEATVISGIGHGCDEEALRIIRTMTFKVPDVGKIKSKFSHQVNIHFRLPGSPAVLPATKKISPAPQSLQVQYQVTTSPVAPKKQPATKSSAYQFTIQLPNSDKIKE